MTTTGGLSSRAALGGLLAVVFAASSELLAAPASAEDIQPSSSGANLALYAKGVFAEMAGETKEARTHFEATLDADPAAFPVARKAAEFQLRTDDLPAASKTLRTYAQEQAGRLDSQLYYADFLEQNAGRDAVARKSASEILEAANERFPHNYEVFSRLINLHENREQRPQSLEVFQAQFEAEGAGPEHWMALAPIARTLLPGDSPELVERLDTIAEKTVETGAGIPMAARTASDYYRKTGRLEEAIGVLEKHVAIAPDSLTMRTRLGLLLLYAKRDEDGLKVLHDTLRIDADQVLAHRSLAGYYGRNGEPEKSLFHNAEVLRIAGGAPEAFLDLANQYLAVDKPHEARLLLEKARFDHPENAAIAARLAVATLRDGDTTTAARLFRQAEALARDSGDPDALAALDPDFQVEFAGSLARAGDTVAAEDRLRTAIRSIPPDQPKTSARALRELARLWIEQDKNLNAATQLLNRAKGLEPDNKETEELLQRAKKGN